MSTRRKRSLTIAGHGTSISLEEPFWAALKEIAAAQGQSLPALVAAVDAGRGDDNLSSALRVFVLGWHRRELACWRAATAEARNAGNPPPSLPAKRSDPAS